MIAIEVDGVRYIKIGQWLIKAENKGKDLLLYAIRTDLKTNKVVSIKSLIVDQNGPVTVV